ncbi:MAG: hypothetical protein U0L25_04200 [Ligilactobacillus ruminis]|uniref:hypothetical protein n=1 Tax=Ligilactobacillus ruminis TaxID=1623 RepID=UPI0002D5CEC3|nr:hypothetical protein [Ligilactobacillus ruminis]MEE1508387.1 hypothetical protein [Ligilactobacillus ruminis]
MAYRKSCYSKKFFEAHREEITLHKASKTAFSRIPKEQKIGGKLPTIKQFSQEYGQILAEKKRLYKEYREAMEEMKTYTMAKHNIDGFLEKSNREEKDHYKKRRNIDR